MISVEEVNWQNQNHARFFLPQKSEPKYQIINVFFSNIVESFHADTQEKNNGCRNRSKWKGLFIWEAGQYKKRDGTIFVPPLYEELFNRDGIIRQDGMNSVPPFWAWITFNIQDREERWGTIEITNERNFQRRIWEATEKPT